ncbi:YhdH/YhfP family quinone oxidoreductase [Isachenkonia alkalipeptolytica]|uniref:Acryloyl-CoA reductase n=1 Tax=Isachenkonia alkalipeptolytica TaxID=2565777 RepID=A0AA43XJ48_9CLOT|nr:YhdH/YhfP family quinone oxidoreductase [Isachenkonia alkalipeptolytica]NBG87274.1 acryloyl-CoA reductase [Isachenkonia alkalipeptolytica]
MEQTLFKTLRIIEEEDRYIRRIESRKIGDLPEGDTIVKVQYSSLNYKDALSSVGNKGVTRNYPHTPGIDAAGTIVKSSDPEFSEGEEVILTGYDLGMNTEGGFGQYIRVPSQWVVKKPEGLDLKESMVYGTAGFTAALSVYKLTKDVDKNAGEVLVTGGTGSVANIASKILVKMGYEVVVATGKVDSQKEELLSLGVKSVISREEIQDEKKKAMLKSRWAGVIDTVGGSILGDVIKSIQYDGAVTTCGNVGGDKFESSVYPFILRGVTLYGIDSVQCPMDLRLKIWEKLAGPWKADNLQAMVEVVSLEEMEGKMDAMLAGKKVGRIVLHHEE